jgi:PEP-CTERM motif
MKSKGFITASLIAALALFSGSFASATPISGLANIAGNVVVSATAINFNPSFTSTAGAMETGSFAGLTGGTIQSLSGGPVTGSVSVPSFIQFSQGVSQPVIFDLNFIAPGVGTLAGCSSSTPGSACTPPGSPFTLFQLTSNTIIAALQVNGNAYTGSAATGSTFTTGIFSTQSAIMGTLPDIYNTLINGGTVNATYSASFAASTAAVPEPGSLFLMGLSLVGAGLVARRRIRS